MPSPPSIPDHTLRRPIGRGAYGEVWLARNVMGAPRAVKIVWRRQFESDRPYEREFVGIQRYEPVSRSADGLVHVLHVGRNDAEGYFYYVMELADSAAPLAVEHSEPDVASRPASAEHTPLLAYAPRTLRSDLKQFGRLPTADCLRLALDVIGGLARLHHQGLVHRDVKPGNIIFVNGRAKLADIGLVSAGGEGRTFVGTEGYIPPEGPGSVAADLYALGVVLYEASTGFSPERFPDVPTEWFAEGAGGDALELHEVVLKACEGQRERRYGSADAMQADLALLQSGQSVRRVRTLQRRYTRLRALGIVGTTLLVSALVAAVFAHYRARLAAEKRARETSLREQAQQAQARAESAEREARQQLNAALFEQARALVLSREMGHRTRALDALRRVAGMTNAAELRRVAFAALSQPDVRFTGEILWPPGRRPLALDPAAARVAASVERGTVSLHALPGGQTVATLGGNTNLAAYQVRWSHDGRYFGVKRETVRGGREGLLEVWEVGATQRLALAGVRLSYGSFTFHPRQPLVMAGRLRGEVAVWNLETGQEVRQFKLPGTLHALEYSPDGTRFAASYNATSGQSETRWVVACHDATTLETVSTLDCPEPVEDLVWHPGGRWISMTGSDDSDWQRNVRLLEVPTGALTVLGRHKLKVSVLKFTADRNYLVSSGWDREVVCWDLRMLERAFTGVDFGFSLFWNAAGTRFAAIPGDALQFYEFESPLPRELRASPSDGIRDGAFSPDGRWLAAQDVRHLCVWDLAHEAPPAVLPKPGELTVFFSPDSTELFASRDRYLERWQVRAATDPGAPPILEPLPARAPPGLRCAAVASNDIIMAATDGVYVVARTNLDFSQGRFHRMREGKAVTSPEGRWLAMVYDFSPSIGVYRLPGVELAARLATSNLVGHASFSPTGDELTVLNRSGVEWWDTGTWQLKRRQPGRPVSGGYALYTPDGSGLWLVTHLRNTGLHDRRTLEPLLPLPAGVVPMAISPDGQTLAVSVDTRRVQLWDLPALRAQFRDLGLDWQD